MIVGPHPVLPNEPGHARRLQPVADDHLEMGFGGRALDPSRHRLEVATDPAAAGRHPVDGDGDHLGVGVWSVVHALLGDRHQVEVTDESCEIEREPRERQDPDPVLSLDDVGVDEGGRADRFHPSPNGGVAGGRGRTWTESL